MALATQLHAVPRALAALVVAFGLAQAAGAHAQAGASADYEVLVEKGIAEYRAGHWEESRALFEQAHAIEPNARTLRGIGLAAYEGRDYVGCIEYLELALEDTRKPLTERQRRSLQEIIAEAGNFVGRFEVHLSPGSATLTVGGYEAKLRAGVLVLNAGEHDLVVQAPGYRQLTRHLSVQGGRGGTLELVLEPASGGERAPAEPAAEAADSSTSQPLSTEQAAGSGPGVGPYIVKGAGGALLIGSGVTALLAVSKYNELEDECSGTDCEPGLESTRDQGQALQVASYALLAAGAVTAAVGLGWLLLADDGEEPAAASPLAFACTTSACHGQWTVEF